MPKITGVKYSSMVHNMTNIRAFTIFFALLLLILHWPPSIAEAAEDGISNASIFYSECSKPTGHLGCDFYVRGLYEGIVDGRLD